MLRPADRAVRRGEVLDRLGDANDRRAGREPHLPLESQLRVGQFGASNQAAVTCLNRVGRNGRLTVNRQSRGHLLRAHPSENVHANVVAHDPGEQLALGIGPVFGVLRRRVSGRLDGRPRRSPERVHPARLVKDLGDVAALHQHGDPHRIGFDLDGAAIAIGCFRHGVRHLGYLTASAYPDRGYSTAPESAGIPLPDPPSVRLPVPVSRRSEDDRPSPPTSP